MGVGGGQFLDLAVDAEALFRVEFGLPLADQRVDLLVLVLGPNGEGASVTLNGEVRQFVGIDDVGCVVGEKQS